MNTDRHDDPDNPALSVLVLETGVQKVVLNPLFAEPVDLILPALIHCGVYGSYCRYLQKWLVR